MKDFPNGAATHSGPVERQRQKGQLDIRSGATKGLAAGAIFAVLQMLLALLAGESLLAPWRMAASVVLGGEGLTTMGVAAFLIGFLIHFSLAALFGTVYGLIMNKADNRTRVSLGREAGLGILFGLALWLLNFQVLARLLYPWFLATPQFVQALLHALAFGLPLALLDRAIRRKAPSGLLRGAEH